MASGLEDAAKVAQLPQEGVHCFAANAKQISTRRIITIILSVAFAALIVAGLVMSTPNYILVAIGVAGLIISVLVFCQTFLIAKYRVAVDYNEKKIVLRYRYSLITIPFENFDARDGDPDRAEAMLNNMEGNVVQYLILDNVFDEACFQTSTKDLASKEDFEQLKKEAFAIADAYGARNDQDAIKQLYTAGGKPIKGADVTGEEAQDDVDDIVKKALSEEQVEETVSEAEEKAEEKTEE